MGWDGSDIMGSVIDGLFKNTSVDNAARRAVYKSVIPAMQEHDWDTEKACLGVDPAYDAVLREQYPDLFRDEQLKKLIELAIEQRGELGAIQLVVETLERLGYKKTIDGDTTRFTKGGNVFSITTNRKANR